MTPRYLLGGLFVPLLKIPQKQKAVSPNSFFLEPRLDPYSGQRSHSRRWINVSKLSLTTTEYRWKVLFLVALDGILAKEGKASLDKRSSWTRNSKEKWKDFSNLRQRTHFNKASPPSHNPAYLFSTFVSDPSRKFLQARSESRDKNGEVRGQYSYMDGFYKVKVLYKAGRGGFTVIRQERTRLKDIKPRLQRVLVKKSVHVPTN